MIQTLKKRRHIHTSVHWKDLFGLCCASRGYLKRSIFLVIGVSFMKKYRVTHVVHSKFSPRSTVASIMVNRLLGSVFENIFARALLIWLLIDVI